MKKKASSTRRHVSVELLKEEAIQVKVYAARQGISITELIRRLLIEKAIIK